MASLFRRSSILSSFQKNKETATRRSADLFKRSAALRAVGFNRVYIFLLCNTDLVAETFITKVLLQNFYATKVVLRIFFATKTELQFFCNMSFVSKKTQIMLQKKIFAVFLCFLFLQHRCCCKG